MLKTKFLVPMTVVIGVAAAAACTAGTGEGTVGQSRSEARGNPPGNNGTVKIQEAGSPDEIPDNDPHVGCVFNIEFRGYDQGDLNATWTLAAQPPSGTEVITGPNTVFIGEDPAGGANDLDAVVTVNMADYDLSGLTFQPQQGYHIKLTVHAEGSIGADTKHKVFWVQGCQPDAGASSSSSSSSSSGGSTSSSSSSSGGSTSSSSGGSTSSTSSSSGGNTW